MAPSDGVAGWFSRPVVGAGMIGVLVLLLAIPIGLVRDLIGDRVEARADAREGVTAVWGGQQSVIGPRLVIPYRRSADAGAEPLETGHLSVLPAALSIEGHVAAQTLERGQFAVPVYESRLTIHGRFEPSDRSAAGLEESELLWDDAVVVIEVSDPRAVGSGSTATWNGEPVALLPGATAASNGRRGLHAVIGRLGDGTAEFEVTLELKGSEALWLVPFSRATNTTITSDWPHPSFSGAWLPDRREVGAAGFSAAWDIPFLGRDYPQTWLSSGEPYDQILTSRFGVELVSPVDQYRMAERSTKYALLFLVLTFSLFWLFDTLAGVRVHPIQYLLVGMAMCVFFLLELSLSEHLGFTTAYAIAAVGVISLVAAYARAVLGSVGRGATMAGSVAALYIYLFALLTLERYALLVGSLGLFAALAAVMHSTRWIDWHEVTGAEAERAVR